jgi:preprotein translocase subunit SecG
VFTFLLTLMILDGVLLTVVVLLQAGKGDGLAAVGGGASIPGAESLIGGRQAATLLTRASWTTGALFLVIALVLSVMSSRQIRPNPILRQEFQQTTPTAPQPVLPGATQPPGAQSQGTAQPGAAGGTQPAIPGTQPKKPGGTQPKK